MSLILEALRKSEQQRRLGEVPTLGSESAWAGRRWHGAPARGARWPWIAAIALLGLAGAAGWWFLAPGAAKRAETRDAPPADATPAGDAPVPAPVAPPTAASAPPAAPVAAPAVAAVPAAPSTPAAPPVAPPTDSAMPREAPTPAVDGEYPESPAPADSIVPSPPSTTTTPGAPPVEPAAPAPASVTAVAQPALPPPAPEPTATPATPPVAASDDVPLVYALPLATRQALPPMKLSMHVWNADPLRRFVIVGETRAAEGEPAGTDLNVVEIRRDGVVLEFRGTRFLLPRGGW
jgi:general secretion pathway protein B